MIFHLCLQTIVNEASRQLVGQSPQWAAKRKDYYLLLFYNTYLNLISISLKNKKNIAL